MRITDLEWDGSNEEHIARHRVWPDEVDEVCLGSGSLAVRIRRGRYRVLGQTESGRYLTVILDGVGGGRFYPVTARDSTDNERRRLQQWRDD